MRVALLSSTLGFGHLRAAQAVDEALHEQDPSVVTELVDVWSLMDETVAGAAREGYLRAVTEQPAHYERLFSFSPEQWRRFFRRPDLPPALVDIINQSLERWLPRRNGFPPRGANLDQTLFLGIFDSLTARTAVPGNLVRRTLVLWMHALLCRRLKQRLLGFRPDVVVALQMMPAAFLSTIKRRHDFDEVPAVAVLTDYGVHDFWVRSNVEHYCVASQHMANDLRARGITDARVSITGMPLMPGFREPLPQREARRRLDLPQDGAVVLITGGGYGIGAAEALRSVLARGPECRILLAAGQSSNGELKSLAAAHPDRVHLFERDVDMPVLIRAADIVIGKPGGLSVSEALACGRPFLALCSLGGQESFNVMHLTHYGVGARVDEQGIAETLADWLAHPDELAGIQRRAWEVGCRHGAELIARAALDGAHQLRGRHEGDGP